MKKMNYLFKKFVLFFYIAAIGFSVCTEGISAKIKIRYWNGFTGPDGKAMLQMVRKFNRENPDIDVRMQRIDWATYYSKLFVAGIGGRSPDVFIVPTDCLMRFANANFIRPVDDLMSGKNGIDVNDLDSNVWAVVKIKQKHYGVPLGIHAIGLYYNKKLFREAGIVDENGKAKPPENRKEFMEAAARLKKDLDGDGVVDQWGFSFTFFRILTYVLIQQWEGEMIADDGEMCVMNDPRNVEALQFCADLVLKHKLAPRPENMDSWIGFRQGKVGMVIDGVYMVADLQRQNDLEFGAAPVPKIGPVLAAFACSHNLCLKAGLKGRRLDAAWRFVKFLSDNSLDWAEAGQIPVRKSLRDTDRFRAMHTQYAFAKQIPYGKPSPIVSSIFELWSEFDIAIEKAIRGKCSPKEALDSATKNYNKVISRKRKYNSSKKNNAAKTVAGSKKNKLKSPHYTVYPKILHSIDDRLFGSFMEHASWHGETGVEAALVPGTRKLQKGVLDRLRQMEISVLRFPGGTDVDYISWTDMIDNVPARTNDAGKLLPRPTSIGHMGGEVSNNFGFDEFHNLCRKLKCEAIIPVNLRDAVKSVIPMKEAAMNAASLVAYCNAPTNAKLPEGMLDWPAVRAANGFVEPFKFKYFQIGNEPWFYYDSLKKYVDCIKKYVALMHKIDPDIEFIMDAFPPGCAKQLHRALKGHKIYFAHHMYLPWGLSNDNIERNGKKYPANKLTKEEIWNAWVGIPNSFNKNGESVLIADTVDKGRELNVPMAVTEWNWNSWWELQEAPFESALAGGIGAAGFMHAMMRSGDAVKIACQSMTVGKNWFLTAIRVSESESFEPFFMPAGQMLMFYSKYHGSKMLKTTGKNIPTYKQPLKMNWLHAQKKIAYVDALTTADKNAIYFHAINRHFTSDIPITIDLSRFKNISTNAVHHIFQGKTVEGYYPCGPAIGFFTDKKLTIKKNKIKVILPAHSISCIEFRKVK